MVSVPAWVLSKEERDAVDADEKKRKPKQAMQRRLSLIWAMYQGKDSASLRYVPMAIPGRAPGSGGWEVFDRKTQKFVTGRKAILRLSFEDCQERLTS